MNLDSSQVGRLNRLRRRLESSIGDLTIISPTLISDKKPSILSKTYCHRGDNQGFHLKFKSAFEITVGVHITKSPYKVCRLVTTVYCRTFPKLGSWVRSILPYTMQIWGFLLSFVTTASAETLSGTMLGVTVLPSLPAPKVAPKIVPFSNNYLAIFVHDYK